MARRDPLLPNAGIVARREYRDRTRSPLFIGSTVVLALIAMIVAIAPIAIRYLDRQTVTRIAVVAADAELGQRAVVGRGHAAQHPAAGRRPGALEEAVPRRGRRPTRPSPSRLLAGRPPRRGHARRAASRAARSTSRSGRTEGPTSARSQVLSVAAFGIGVLDWSARLPAGRDARPVPSARPSRSIRSTPRPTAASPLDARQAASRYVLGIVFVVLLFITIVIYGMWVATGVAAEKSSRVMELMISAASPRQMLTGKVVGIGVGRADPVRRDRHPGPRAARVPGPDRRGGPRARLGQRRAARRADAGPAARLRRLLPARVHAVRADLRGDGLVRQPAGRPPDAVAAAEPAWRWSATSSRSSRSAAGAGRRSCSASFLPPFSPFVMLARLMVSAVAAVGGRAVGRRCWWRPSRSWRSSRRGCTRRASCSTASGRGCARSSRRRGAADQRAGLSLVVERQPADQRQDRRRGRGRRRPDRLVGRARRPRPRPLPGRAPPRTATAGCGPRAGTGSPAGGPGSRRCPGRRPPRTARCPRSRWPAPRRPRRPGAAPAAAPRAGGRAAATAASDRRDGAGRRRGTRPAVPARRPAAGASSA